MSDFGWDIGPDIGWDVFQPNGSGSVVTPPPPPVPANAILLLPDLHYTGGARIYGLVACAVAFRVDIQISYDLGFSWITAKSINSAAGNDTTYPAAAEVNLHPAAFVRLLASTLNGNPAAWVNDTRAFLVFGA